MLASDKMKLFSVIESLESKTITSGVGKGECNKLAAKYVLKTPDVQKNAFQHGKPSKLGN